MPRTKKAQRNIKITISVIGLLMVFVGIIISRIGKDNTTVFIVGLALLFIGLGAFVFALLYDFIYALWTKERKTGSKTSTRKKALNNQVKAFLIGVFVIGVGVILQIAGIFTLRGLFWSGIILTILGIIISIYSGTIKK